MKNSLFLFLLLLNLSASGQFSQLFEDSHTHYDKEKQLLIDSKYQIAKAKGYVLFSLDKKQIFDNKEFGFEICHFEVFLDSFIIVTEVLPEYAHHAVYSYVSKYRVVIIPIDDFSKQYCINLESSKLLFLDIECKAAIATNTDNLVYKIPLLKCH